MEQKKTLWIIAASGIFLLVIVGAAMILYSPSFSRDEVRQASFDSSSIGWISTEKNSDDESSSDTAVDALGANSPVESSDVALASSTGEKAADASDAPSPNPFEAPIKANNITVVTDNTTVFSTDTKSIDLNALKSPNVSAKNEYTESQISKSKSDSLPKNYYTPPAKSSTKVAAAPKSEPKAAAPKTSSSAAATPKAASATASSPAAKAPVATAPAAQDKFWVQASAYSSKKNADEARSVLEDAKIPTEVFTVDANGTTMYRVRVGPYTTKSEAEYWQKEIAKLEKFADTKSQIFETKVN